MLVVKVSKGYFSKITNLLPMNLDNLGFMRRIKFLAIVHALKKWWHYLLSQVFELVIDHKSLKWIFTQPDLNIQQRTWEKFLQEFTFEIKFRLGKENQAVDALSRRVIALAISLVSSTLPKEIQ